MEKQIVTALIMGLFLFLCSCQKGRAYSIGEEAAVRAAWFKQSDSDPFAYRAKDETAVVTRPLKNEMKLTLSPVR